MVTAVDTNIFLDILAGDVPLKSSARNALIETARQGPLTLSAVCYAELAGNFEGMAQLNIFLDELNVQVVDLDEPTAFLAGRFYKEYRLRGGTRTRILPDFLIAAHAQIHADRLLTRDNRFFGESFPSLKAVTPEDI